MSLRFLFLVFRNFNSIKVRLEPILPQYLLFNHLFQFHKGTIRTKNLRLIARSLSYFNSIKVRLEHLSFDNNTTMDLFQFHKGTIRTKRNL